MSLRILADVANQTVLAQIAPGIGNQTAAIMVGLTVLLLLIVVGCFALMMVARSLRHSRQLLHEERMKSLERDGTWGDPNQQGPVKSYVDGAFWLCFWLVLVGCSAPFVAIASIGGFTGHQGIVTPIIAWLGATAASITASICATVIMGNTRLVLRPRDSEERRGGS